jgi:hypothetical protein
MRKAQFSVICSGGETYPVVVRYKPNEFVAEIKNLIVSSIKAAYDGFESLKAGYLILKTRDGTHQVTENRMIPGDEFIAEIHIPKVTLRISTDTKRKIEYDGSAEFESKRRNGRPLSGSLLVDERNAELARYKRISEIISDDQLVNLVVNNLEKIRELQFEKNIPIPFVSISNSSGTGKTQFAFCIKKCSKNPVYFLISSFPGDTSQTIYHAFRNSSKFLNLCVNRDLENSSLKEITDFSVANLRTEKLYSYAFIKALLEFGEDHKSEIDILPLTYDDVSYLVKESKPIVILDEFMSLSRGRLFTTFAKHFSSS